MAKTKKTTNVEMTQKEALAILHHLDARLRWLLYEEDAAPSDVELRSQVYDAFSTLDRAIHRDIGPGQLCQVCYLRKESGFVLDIDLYPVTGITPHLDCCLTCLEQLKAEKRPMVVKRYDYQQKDFVIVERYDQPQEGTTEGAPTEEASK